MSDAVKIEPCPNLSCGDYECVKGQSWNGSYWHYRYLCSCGYRSPNARTREGAIALHDAITSKCAGAEELMDGFRGLADQFRVTAGCGTMYRAAYEGCADAIDDLITTYTEADHAG